MSEVNEATAKLFQAIEDTAVGDGDRAQDLLCDLTPEQHVQCQERREKLDAEAAANYVKPAGSKF